MMNSSQEINENNNQTMIQNLVDIIEKAILKSPNKKLSVGQIYEYIMDYNPSILEEGSKKHIKKKIAFVLWNTEKFAIIETVKKIHYWTVEDNTTEINNGGLYSLWTGKSLVDPSDCKII